MEIIVSFGTIYAEACALRHPELKVYLTQDRAWKEKYHQNMFDAVALGMMLSMKHRQGGQTGLFLVLIKGLDLFSRNKSGEVYK